MMMKRDHLKNRIWSHNSEKLQPQHYIIIRFLLWIWDVDGFVALHTTEQHQRSCFLLLTTSTRTSASRKSTKIHTLKYGCYQINMANWILTDFSHFTATSDNWYTCIFRIQSSRKHTNHGLPWAGYLENCQHQSATRGQSNLTKNASRGAHSPVRVTPGGRKLYHWIPGVGVPISVP